MSYKLLLADDSVTIQKVVELTFSEEDFEILAVGDGNAAFEKARAEKPDIILSDVIMPGMNGYEFCTKVKQDGQLKRIPFLFLKGTFESFDEERAASAGGDGYIVKPFESQELVSRVKELVEKYRSAAPPAEAPAPAPAVPGAAEEFAGFEEATAEEEPAAAAPAAQGMDAIFGGPLGALEPPLPEPAAVPEEDLWSEVKISDHPIPPAGYGKASAPAFEEVPLMEEVTPLEEEPEPAEIPGLHSAAKTAAEAWPEAPPVSRPAPPPPPRPVSAPSPGGMEKALADKVEEVLRNIAPEIIRKVTQQVISEVVWEVVPETAERLIKKEIERLTGGTRP